MRKYISEKKLQTLCCNCCGRKIEVQNGIPMEDIFHAEKQWGYFSDKDGRVDSFDLCEECYDAIIKGFKIKVKEREAKELI